MPNRDALYQTRHPIRMWETLELLLGMSLIKPSSDRLVICDFPYYKEICWPWCTDMTLYSCIFPYKLINCSAPRLGKQVCLLRNKSKLCALTNGKSGCRENNVQHPPTSKAVFPKLYTYIEITKCCYYDGSLSHTSPETLASVWQCDMGAGKKCRILDYFRSDVQNLYFNFSDFMPRNNWRCYSKPSSCQRTSSINIIWKLIRYINSQTPSQIYWFTFSGTGIQ